MTATQKSILFTLPVAMMYLLSLHLPFFWDTTHLASAQAQWFYNNGLNKLLLPDSIDSGHPPLTGWLLAFTWKLFGKGLLQSHLMMLPFLVIMLTYMHKTLRHYFPEWAWLISALFFLNPILLTQSMLVSPDIILFTGFFLALYGIIADKKLTLALGAVLLSMVSMRGMMCVAGLFIFDFLKNARYRHGINAFVLHLLNYAPSAIIAAAFLIFHAQNKGWIGYHPSSPWAPSFKLAGITEFFRNLMVLAFRMADQGMLFIWIIPAWILVKQKNSFSSRSKELLLLSGVLFCSLVLPQLFYKNLLMHRYLYPCISILTLLSFSIVLERGRPRTYILSTSLLLVSGFTWIYPEPLAKGWDIMPLHYSYYEHRANILQKITTRGLQTEEIGAAFPYNLPSSIIDLSDNSRQFAEPDLANRNYILYSNISNDFTGEMINTLRSTWIPIERSGRWPVYFILYKNPGQLLRKSEERNMPMASKK
ncbi:MAG TPA: hypothetical protein VLA58_02265 [Chitinophagaceae bacterium]|nr:hypothetical protein [Chitinophagaceae bacterium]